MQIFAYNCLKEEHSRVPVLSPVSLDSLLSVKVDICLSRVVCCDVRVLYFSFYMCNIDPVQILSTAHLLMCKEQQSLWKMLIDGLGSSFFKQLHLTAWEISLCCMLLNYVKCSKTYCLCYILMLFLMKEKTILDNTQK